MATLDNGHASEGIAKVVGSSGVSRKPKQTNIFRWTFGLIVRLCIWYVLLTPFIRCPSHLSELNESSPHACKPYLVARSYIEPHVLPYYNTYGAPYVEKARPYVVFIDEKVYTPATNVVKLGYEKYGAPTLNQAHAYASQEWESQVGPRLQTAKDKVGGLYNSELAPHVQRATAVVSPYYSSVKKGFDSACVDYIQPFLAQASPFIGKTYTSGQDVLTTTVIPYAQNSWSSVIYFANGWLLPKITGLYTENVEPQLVKIGQRLASHREGKEFRKVADDAESSSDQQTNTAASAHGTSTTVSTPITSVTASSSTTHTPSSTERAVNTREKIEIDLRTWQEKFAVAADKGFEDLEERIQELVDDYVTRGAKVMGEDLVTALDFVAQEELSTVKRRISEITESLPEDESPEEDAAQSELIKDIRQAAITIRDRAHAIREWHRSFNQELSRGVSTAVDSTLDVLDSVRDLGLQEIGMRWAWMDGVTYKDWARYHQLKAQFEDWKVKFREAGMQHSKLEDARALSDEILSRGMDGAELAAKELARLKGVGKWKISAREVSENFDTRSGPPPPLPGSSDKSSHLSRQDSPDAEAASSQPSVQLQHDADVSTVPDSTESEDEHMGSDDELMEHGQSTLQRESTSPNSEPTLGESDVFATQDPINEEDPTKSTWGVAAAELSEDESSRREYHEQLYRPISEESANHPKGATNPVEDVDKAIDGQVNEEQRPGGVSASDSPVVHYEAVETLISELLVGKDASFAEDVMNKLHAIYGTQYPSKMQIPTGGGHEASSISSETTTSTAVSEEVGTDEFQPATSSVYEPATSLELTESSSVLSTPGPSNLPDSTESVHESFVSTPTGSFHDALDQESTTASDASVSETEVAEAAEPSLQDSDERLETAPVRAEL
ncbi:hypothetical protein BDV25DRAFT_75957 [Aspergillus avenaceus]|uniref:Transcription factor hoxa13 n=1 Tax=Aspergillus avenaceus TaxID=36643 RepID=A0A5N6TFL4_ASPAV|nr:hypothetical protein BDV25DRAFT_75957 [Aspergillus avenaceus]